MLEKYPNSIRISDFCYLPAESGDCRGRFPSIYYDVTTDSCKPFVYGGCDSNKNWFESVEVCMKTCSKARVPRRFEDNVSYNVLVGNF